MKSRMGTTLEAGLAYNLTKDWSASLEVTKTFIKTTGSLSTGQTILTGSTGKWFNLKVAFNIQTRQVRTYINNCLKKTYKGDRGDGNFYFKHGVYFCKTSTNGCFSHYKNIHLYKK